jgi:hypothetical protein
MGEGRRAVLLEEEMPDPGEGIACDEAGEQPPEVERGKGMQDGERAEARAGEVQPAAGAVGVLPQIKRVELGKSLETLGLAGILSPV